MEGRLVAALLSPRIGISISHYGYKFPAVASFFGPITMIILTS